MSQPDTTEHQRLPKEDFKDSGARVSVRRRRRITYCPYCSRERAFSRRTFDHSLHAILTVFTVGAWGGVWVASALRHRYKNRWRCCTCGHRARRTLSESESHFRSRSGEAENT